DDLDLEVVRARRVVASAGTPAGDLLRARVVDRGAEDGDQLSRVTLAVPVGAAGDALLTGIAVRLHRAVGPGARSRVRGHAHRGLVHRHVGDPALVTLVPLVSLEPLRSLGPRGSLGTVRAGCSAKERSGGEVRACQRAVPDLRAGDRVV